MGVWREQAPPLTEQKHAEWCHSMVLLSWALTAGYVCVHLVGNTAEEIQVSRVHSH